MSFERLALVAHERCDPAPVLESIVGLNLLDQTVERRLVRVGPSVKRRRATKHFSGLGIPSTLEREDAFEMQPPRCIDVARGGVARGRLDLTGALEVRGGGGQIPVLDVDARQAKVQARTGMVVGPWAVRVDLERAN